MEGETTARKEPEPGANPTFTHGRAARSAGRVQRELEKLREQSAPHSIRMQLEATIAALLEYEQRNRPMDVEKLAEDVLAAIRAGR